MIELAEHKANGIEGVRFTQGDAFDPPLPEATYDAVLCRHVLWAMPDPADALTRWLRLLTPTGCLFLVEGHWSNGASPSPRTGGAASTTTATS
jgi:ubiquinone/menaquinone biosynthesis C-methylase UbiE